MAVGYNLNHVQVAAKEETPVFVDVSGAVSFDPGITADSEDVLADGTVYTTAYSAPVGEGDLTFVDAKFGVFAVINGGVISSSGTGDTAIERYEQPGSYVPVPFIISDWVPNIDRVHDADVAGMRTTIPNATSAPVSRSSGQETVFEWAAAVRFTAETNEDPLIIYEKLATAPTFTNGVMPVLLSAPTP